MVLEFRRHWLLCATLATGLSFAAQPVAGQSAWAAIGPDGKLAYRHLPGGDHIADFSSAGYRGGGVALPMVPMKRAVTPSGQDDTAAIQKAIDEVAALPQVDGFRGAVVLRKGTYHCFGTILLTVSGVVLRGEGADDTGTTIVMTGEPHVAIRVRGKLDVQTVGAPVQVADTYVPSGATTFHVTDASGIHAGDTLSIVKPVTPAWVQFMGMDALGLRGGKPEHWIDGTLQVRRRVASVKGNAVTLAVPLMDSYDAKYLGVGAVSVTRVQVSGQVEEVGVEDLRVVAPSRSITFGTPEFDGLMMNDAADCWLRSLVFLETTSSVGIDSGTERISVVRTDVVNKTPIVGEAKPSDFEANGQQILFDRITASGDRTFFFLTQAKQQGPVVLLHCRFTGDSHIQPHQRWFTGLLIDGCDVPDGGIDLMNRGMMGSGHGWAIGWSVIWNSSAKSFAVNTPPGTANWSIGNRGEELNPPQPARDAGKEVALQPGMIESPGKQVKPASLYLEQLSERLGRDALRNIGYK
ncbi:hypothetical protein SAMN05421819_0048 [Bryocella elongata]|uniref:Pectate lyase superfamily protein n=1 Tax=Bryocella elongata TaxID=863522 RepID=A0A1H5S249_9BACT|nr:hypothetical protein [Bryocella elongata]SEF44703.1 hypothetical protein SAMN05421819_0048 [Bryocella elongata]